MGQLVRDLADSDEFDLIVYDTPPVLGLADAALVAEQIDGLMLLVSLDRVDRSLPKEAVARIRSSGAPLLGLVTNAVKEQRQGSSAYGYGNGYGNYGYNPGTTYAYYAEGDAQGASNGKPGLPTAASDVAPLQQLKQQLSRFWAWVDR
jgi:Mrp family chromosome partitioning ATPase